VRCCKEIVCQNRSDAAQLHDPDSQFSRLHAMSFAQFDAAIASPALKRVAAHWNAARTSRRMPAWSDIKPAAIKTQLPIVWSYKYVAGTGEFIGRLAGEQITSVLGRKFQGALLSEIFAPPDFEWVCSLFCRVVTEPTLYLGVGRVFQHLNRLGKGSRIMLPLSGDGATADGILGATEYQFSTLEEIARDEPLREEMQWFALD
jgi:hypothetical protein